MSAGIETVRNRPVSSKRGGQSWSCTFSISRSSIEPILVIRIPYSNSLVLGVKLRCREVTSLTGRK